MTIQSHNHPMKHCKEKQTLDEEPQAAMRVWGIFLLRKKQCKTQITTETQQVSQKVSSREINISQTLILSTFTSPWICQERNTYFTLSDDNPDERKTGKFLDCDNGCN